MRENPYRHSAPPGWSRIVSAPRDGTMIEIQNNWGVAPWFGVFKWVHDRGWVDAKDDSSGVTDGPHLSWRAYEGRAENYRDPTDGAQNTEGYWRTVCGLK